MKSICKEGNIKAVLFSLAMDIVHHFVVPKQHECVKVILNYFSREYI